MKAVKQSQTAEVVTNVLQFPKIKKSRKKVVQAETMIIQVDFRRKVVQSVSVVNNVTGEVTTKKELSKVA